MNLRRSTRELDGRVVATVAGELDHSNADALRTLLVQALDWPVRDVIVDLGGLCFIDSTGLSALITAWKHAQTRALAFSLATPSVPCRRCCNSPV